MQMEIQIAGSGYGDALHALQAGNQRHQLLGNLARRLAHLLGQLETARHRHVTHRGVGRRIKRGRGDLQVKGGAHGLHELGLNLLLNFQ